MSHPARTSADAQDTDFVRDLIVEVFLARGTRHHGDLPEAADELLELFACFDMLSEANEALIRRKVDQLARRADRNRLRLVTGAMPREE